MVNFLKDRGYWVRGVDIKWPEYEDSRADDFEILDLREFDKCLVATRKVDEVYQLAADMGGIGFISGNHAEVARNNVLINAHMLEAAAINEVGLYFYSSSACIYPMHLQESPNVDGLKEEDAYPAQAEEGYGWEKLYSEKMCQYYTEDKGLPTRVARFHNVYGPLGTYDGGREKAPAAIARKVALAEDGGEIEIWGDGLQTRSFMFIDDCVDGIYRITQSDHSAPLNLGTDVLITINDLVDLVSKIAGKSLTKKHDTSKPQGVRGRNSDNSRLREVFQWEPQVSLEDGLGETYEWISAQLGRNG
jgi:nucleoside-diphosphate-sugar epimerase